MTINPVPDGYHTVTPYLIVKNASEAIEFYKTVFGATELMRLPGPEGKVMHAEIKIGDSPIMMADEFPEMGFRGPLSIGGTPVSTMLYVEEVDEIFHKALEHGAVEVKPLADQFYGDRCGTIRDPFGHVWSISKRIENLTNEEVMARFEEEMGQQ